MTGYTRQSSANLVDGNTLYASYLNSEYNQLEAAFDATSGHTHDGSTGGGPKLDINNATVATLDVARGGTGGTTPSQAQTNLQVYSKTEIDNQLGDLSGITDAVTARANIGLTLGSQAQAWDQSLDDISGITHSDGIILVSDGSNWVAESGVTARTSLGLGTIATQDANSVSITGGSIAGIADLAIADGGTGASTAQDARNNLYVYGQGIIDDMVGDLSGVTDASTARSNLDVYSTSEVDGKVASASITGEIRLYAGIMQQDSDVPSGWLPCDGREVSRTTYSNLYNVVGTAYGAGNGSTTFNLPDLRGRFPLGLADSTGLGVPGHATDRNRGDTGGTETHVITEAELPSHRHGDGTLATDINTHSHGNGSLSADSAGNHRHYFSVYTNYDGSHRHGAGNGGYFQTTAGSNGAEQGNDADNTPYTDYAGNHRHSVSGYTNYNGSHGHNISGSTAAVDHSHDVTGMTDWTGSNAAHENMPPFVTVNFIIAI